MGSSIKEKKVFAFCVSASKGKDVKNIVGVALAANEEEMQEQALITSSEVMCWNDGWDGHQAIFFQVPDDMPRTEIIDGKECKTFVIGITAIVNNNRTDLIMMIAAENESVAAKAGTREGRQIFAGRLGFTGGVTTIYPLLTKEQLIEELEKESLTIDANMTM